MSAAADAIAKAKEIAAKLSGNLTGGKRRWGDEGENPGLGAIIKKKVYIPTREFPDINFLGLLIGPKGSTQKQLQDSTGAKILIRGKGAHKDGSGNHPDDEDELHVAIEGPEDSVERASREVEKILYNPEQAMRLKSEQLRTLAEFNNTGAAPSAETIYGPGETSNGQYQIELRVPNNMVGLIIGKGGETILRIQTSLNVNAQIAKESEMKPGETLRSIIVRGQEENVHEAKRRIDDIINQQNQKMTGGSSTNVSSSALKDLDTKYVLKLPIPNDKVGIVIGKGGLTVKNIQERTRTTIQIPQLPDEDNPSTRTIHIGGDIQDAIYKARDEVLQTIQSFQANNPQASSGNTLFVTVPDEKVGIIIGKGGATVRDIQSRLTVRVQIPQAADVGSCPPVRTISISGPTEFLPVAKYEIEMIAAGTPVHSISGTTATNAWGSAPQNPWQQQQTSYGGSYYQDPSYGAAQYAASGYAAAASGYQSQYGYYGASAAAAPAPVAAVADVNAMPTDPTAYYADFWQYAVYYGDAAARMYYGAWSPPEGTPPPEGYVIPSAEQAAANIAAASAGADAVPPQDVSAQVQAVPPTTPPPNSISSSAAADVVAPATESVNAADQQQQPSEDAAWEAYKKQYAEWYESYGKAAGADPNPPGM